MTKRTNQEGRDGESDGEVDAAVLGPLRRRFSSLLRKEWELGEIQVREQEFSFSVPCVGGGAVVFE